MHIAALVLALHALVVWGIAASIAPRLPRAQSGELHMVLVRAAPQPRPAEPPPVALAAVVPPPEIVIENEAGPAAVAAISPADVLAPRPDPRHPNTPPEHRDASKLAPPLLGILVAEDGSVADAQVVRSSGDGAADSEIVAYIEAHWRFLPALVKQKTAIRYWLTVSVPFA
ncbi:MAG TPA: energy transducer TonB [Rhizomicrobium sp.]|nr:energy transducer TonB [Rhizomicrobium sp.]